MQALDPNDLEQAAGGMKLDRLRASYNVEDRRRGAPPRWRQVLDTGWTDPKRRQAAAGREADGHARSA
jgi:hypothetical protein